MGSSEITYGGLGYVGVAAPDPAAWIDFATNVCGLMPAPMPPGEEGPIRMLRPEAGGVAADGTAYLKLDDRQWRLAVHPDPNPGLRYLGFELHSGQALDAAVARIESHGASVRAGTPEEKRARGVERLAVLADPAGHRIELFSNPVRDKGFVSPTGSEFLTGELGMGHVVLYVPDLDTALGFYCGVLGFQRTDYMHFGPNGMGIHFLRCTRRHHSVALLHLSPQLSGLQHLMLETTSLDGVGGCLDRAMAAGIPITSSLGRHRNDGTVSFYMQGPSGFDVEIGWDGVLVGDDWVEHEFAGGGDDWGHHGLDAESLKPRGES
jgi:3,4-dihydroxy-9,10-secoandrosta-1,3,5(10)-triene-9,17-dione 4,5-dioxygenase